MNTKQFLSIVHRIIEVEGLITQEAVARESGLSQSTISSYATQKAVKPKAANKKKVVKALCSLLDNTEKQLEDYIKPAPLIINETVTDSMGLEEDNNVFKLNDPLDAEHLKITRQFKNKHMACSINRALVELESLDDAAFAKVFLIIKEKIEEARELKKRPAANENE